MAPVVRCRCKESAEQGVVGLPPAEIVEPLQGLGDVTRRPQPESAAAGRVVGLPGQQLPDLVPECAGAECGVSRSSSDAPGPGPFRLISRWNRSPPSDSLLIEQDCWWTGPSKTSSLSVPHTLRARAVRPTPGCSPTTIPVSTTGNRRDPACNGPQRACVATDPATNLGSWGRWHARGLETVTGRTPTRMAEPGNRPLRESDGAPLWRAKGSGRGTSGTGLSSHVMETDPRIPVSA